MANGKGPGRLKTGIKITNPLSLPVQVQMISKTGALRIGAHYAASRVIKPGDTLTIGTKGKAEVDINVNILRYDETGKVETLGTGGIQQVRSEVGTAAPKKAPKEAKKRKEPEEPPLRSLGEMIEEFKKREEVSV